MTEHSWDHAYDVIVVGSGTGVFPAILSAKQGLSTVVVEKDRLFGGSTALSGGGMWMPGNRIVRKSGAEDTRGRAETYLRTVVGDEAPEARWQTHLDYAAKVVEAILANTDLRLIHMKEYADYFSDEPGGSAIGRSVEPAPYDLNKLGDDRKLLQASGIAAPIPMPITGADFKWMNLMTKRPDKASWRIARRVAQGLGGLALGKDYAAGGQALAAALIVGARKAGVHLWNSTPPRRPRPRG